MTRTDAVLGAVVACLLGIILMAPSAAGAQFAPSVLPPLGCDPFAAAGLEPAAPAGVEPSGAARLSERAAEAGVVEPNVEEAYRRALRAPPLRHAARARASGAVHVPVYVHVIRDNAAEVGPTAAQIQQQIDVLNDSFAGAFGGNDTGFAFDLVSADDTINADWSPLVFGGANERAAKAALHEGGVRALNLYVVKLGNILGWATFPNENPGGAMDGVVVRSNTLPGNVGQYGLGDTATHEIGHWLGLFHTFQGECSAENDLVADTPAHTENYGCPAGQNTCPALPGNDPITNFMNYTDDSCMFEFTQGQGDRMHALTAQYRNTPPAPDPVPVATDPGKAVPLGLDPTDPDGDELTYEVMDSPDHGSLAGAGSSLAYTPTAGYEGPDSVAVRATDVFGASGEAVVPITVRGTVDLLAAAKAKQRLKRLAITGGCGAEACEVAVDVEAKAKPPKGGRLVRARAKSFSFSPASGHSEPSGAAKLKPRLPKAKAKRLLELLHDGWKAKATAQVTATDASGATGSDQLTIALKP